MRVRVELLPPDHGALHGYTEGTGTRIAYTLLAVGMPGAVLLGLFFEQGGTLELSQMLLGLAFVGAMYGARRFDKGWKSGTLPRWSTAWAGPPRTIEYVLHDRGIQVRSDDEDTLVEWQDVVEVVDREEHFFLSSPSKTYIVPKRAFRTPTEASLFLETIRVRIRDAPQL